jgi:hypothetical protein
MCYTPRSLRCREDLLLSGVKDLLNRLPPRRVSGFTALGPGDQRLLETVCHLPPLSHLRIIFHLLHIARIIVAHIFEAGEKDAGAWVMEYAIYTLTVSVVMQGDGGTLSVWLLNCFMLSMLDYLQSTILHSLICLSTSGHTAAWTSLYLSTYSGLSFTI